MLQNGESYQIIAMNDVLFFFSGFEVNGENECLFKRF